MSELFEKSIRVLELPRLLEMLEHHAVSAEAKARARRLTPSDDFGEVNRLLDETDAARKMIMLRGSPAFGGVRDVGEALSRAERGGMLNTRELLDIAGLLTNVRRVQDYYKEDEEGTVIDKLFLSLHPNRFLEEKIFTSITGEDEIADSASSELASIRRLIRAASARVHDALQKIISSPSYAKALQEPIITTRSERYVVPVKAEHRGDVPGLVHDTSSTGATVFVEPQQVVEINNQIKVLEGREEAEIERILASLSAEVSMYKGAIEQDYDALTTLDFIFARAKLSFDMNACAPVLVEDGSRCKLLRARHPLLDKDKAVPIDIAIGYDYDTLVITGPNTGGKTVSLKTLGLLSLMAASGLHIPANEQSEIGLFEHVYADIGDEQSIEQSLSTFSAHMKTIVSIMDCCGQGDLVLFDELGAGTDPVEGAALAVSVLTELKERHAKVCATTHYQEVKMFALQTEGVENASCEFDVNTLKPTYRLIVGVPGKSNAFAISQRLGMPDDVIERAKELVSTENKRFEQVVDALEKSRQELEALKESAAVSERNAKLTESELKHKLSELEQQKEKELESARQRALSIVEETRFRSNQLLNELEELKKVKDKEALRQGLSSMKGKTNSTLNKMQDEANPVVERRAESYVLPRPLKAGDTVMLADTKKEGVLMTVPNMSGVCYVQVGMMKIKTNQKNLRLVDNKKKQPTPQKSVGGSVKKQVTSNMNRRGGMELDIRGMMTDEGVLEMERFIDSAQLSGISTVIIIHGKGTGALRAAVQQALKTNPAVKSYRQGAYGEGEAGVTVVELK